MSDTSSDFRSLPPTTGVDAPDSPAVLGDSYEELDDDDTGEDDTPE